MTLRRITNSGALLRTTTGALARECCCTTPPDLLPAPQSGLVIDETPLIKHSGCKLNISGFAAAPSEFSLEWHDAVTDISLHTTHTVTYQEVNADGVPEKPDFDVAWSLGGSISVGDVTHTIAPVFFAEAFGRDMTYQYPIDFPFPASWYWPGTGAMSVSIDLWYPVRLGADIKQYGQPPTDKYGTEWGPTTYATQPRDLRGYLDSRLDWYFWPQDAVTSGGLARVTITANSRLGDITIYDAPVSGSLSPLAFRAITTAQADVIGIGGDSRYAALDHIHILGGTPKMGVRDGDSIGPDVSVYEPPDGTITVTADDDCLRMDHVPTIERYQDLPPGHMWLVYGYGGYYPPEYYLYGSPRVLLSFAGDPAYEFDVTADAENLVGMNLPENTMTCDPYDGPAQETRVDDVNPQAVLHHCPVLYSGGLLDYVNSPPITLPASGRWQKLARNYTESRGYQIAGWVTTGRTIMEANTPTGDGVIPPAVGFVYNTAKLTAAGYDKNAWRVPLMLPLDSAFWDAIGIEVAPAFAIDPTLLPFMSAGGTMVASATLGPPTVDWASGRYLTATFNCAAASTGNVLMVDGMKLWGFDLNAGATTVVFDLCAPHNRAGVDTDEFQNALDEPFAQQGGWGWGLKDSVKIDITVNTAGAVALTAIGLRTSPILPGHAAVVGEMVDNLGDLLIETDADPTTTEYLRRCLVYLVDGKVTLDIPGGREVHGVDALTGLPKKYAVPYSIDHVEQDADDRNGMGLLTVRNFCPYSALKRPVGHGQFIGPRDYYLGRQFFNNGQPSYHLLPGGSRWDSDSVDPILLAAHFGVDRIEFGPGTASQRIYSRRTFGGGVAGVVAGTAGALPGVITNAMRGGQRMDGDTTDLNGSYQMPRIARTLQLPGTYTVTRVGGATDGTLAQAEQGVLHRRCLP